MTKEISLWEGLVSFDIPQEMEIPSHEIIEKRFPYDLKPQKIWMSEIESKILTFNLLEKELYEEQLYPALSEIMRLINRMYPESINSIAQCTNADTKKVGHFSFITGGLKEDQYHFIFIFPVNNRMVFGSYHIPAGQAEKGRRAFKEMLKSIRIREISEGEK